MQYSLTDNNQTDISQLNYFTLSTIIYIMWLIIFIIVLYLSTYIVLLTAWVFHNYLYYNNNDKSSRAVTWEPVRAMVRFTTRDILKNSSATEVLFRASRCKLQHQGTHICSYFRLKSKQYWCAVIRITKCQWVREYKRDGATTFAAEGLGLYNIF